MTLIMASTMKVNSISSRSVSRAVTGQGRRTLVVRAAVAVPKEVRVVHEKCIKLNTRNARALAMRCPSLHHTNMCLAD